MGGLGLLEEGELVARLVWGDARSWKQVNVKEGHIEIMARMAKKKVRRIVPMPANLKQWLLPFIQSDGEVCRYSRLSNQWNKFARRAGVEWTRNVHQDSGISYAVASKRNVEEVALDSGNSLAVIRSNYLKAVTPKEADKWFTVSPPMGWNPFATSQKLAFCVILIHAHLDAG